MLNHWIRYFPVLHLLRGFPDMSVLEVGSGNTGVGEFVPKRFVGCDIAFDGGDKGNWIVPIVASGTQLPFREGSFKAVICLDTLEHIPRIDRPAVVLELIRVASTRVIIGCPAGEAARDADIKLQEWYTRRSKQAPVWLEEHMALVSEFPVMEEIQTVITQSGHTPRIIPGEGQALHVLLSKLEDMRITGRIMRMLSRSPWRQILRPWIRSLALSGTYRTYLVVEKR